MAAGTSALNFALILSGILLRLTPERAPRTVLRYERPENLGFYACLVTTNVKCRQFQLCQNVSIGECSSNSPFLKNNGAEAPKGARPIVFKEWRDTRTFSNLKSTNCTLLIL